MQGPGPSGSLNKSPKLLQDGYAQPSQPALEELQDRSPELDWQTIQSRRPWRLAGMVAFGLSFLLAGAFLIDHFHVPTQSEMLAARASVPVGPTQWEAGKPPDPSLIRSIDFAHIHSTLFPTWIISLQNDPYGRGRWDEERAFAALVSEAGKDPNLQGLLTSLRDRATDHIVANQRYIKPLFAGWNKYLEAQGLPFRLEFDILHTAQGGQLYTRSYRVLSDVPVAVGSMTVRAKLLTRIDHTNLGEMFFGQTSRYEDNGAVILTDRIMEFAIDRIWPLFDEQGTLLSSTDRSFAPALRDEARAVLSPHSLTALKASAPARRLLVEMLDSIRFRRTCGRAFLPSKVGWNGLDYDSQDRLTSIVEHNEKKRCGRVTRHDGELLLETSRILAETPGLEQALQELGGWLAKAVSVHELSHLVDDAQAPQGERTPRCETCPRGLTTTQKAELSAYLSSMSSEGIGYLSLFQACGLDLDDPGSNTSAVSLLLPYLAPSGCESGPPEDLYQLARSQQMTLFGRVLSLEIPATFPRELPIPSARIALVTRPAQVEEPALSILARTHLPGQPVWKEASSLFLAPHFSADPL